MPYQQIVFIQGEQSDEPLDLLFNRDAAKPATGNASVTT
jgi:hypothetical protein